MEFLIPFLSFLIIIAFVALIIYLCWYNSPKQKGKRGEIRIHNIIMQLPDEYYVLDDVVLLTNRGTTQIDHIVVSKYGVFAIETKNYRGDIYGDDERQEWKQIIVTKVTYEKNWWKTYTYVTKNHFYNPVKQAVGHVYRIKENLKEWPYLKVIPIVVFTGKAVLKNVKSENHVIYDYELLPTIQSYRTTFLSNEEVKKVAERLSQKNVRKLVDDKTHVRNVKSIQYDANRKITSEICPKCGGQLVMRSGRYGYFYGCSNYPKCQFSAQC